MAQEAPREIVGGGVVRRTSQVEEVSENIFATSLVSVARVPSERLREIGA